ncbi:glycosyltransferase, partial [bacterium]|nr:glycosyltransferase [bacterium]
MKREAPRISVGAPLYNEEESAAEFIRRVLTVLDTMPGGPHQLVLVDDGSTDGTLEILRDHASDTRVRVVALSRNFGHQAALTAAVDFLEGEVGVLMDADLQDTPETIATFVDHYRDGFD